MATVNQGMSVEEIEQIVAQRVANAIEAIAIYESINQTKQQENKVAGNASNKRKWESDHNGSSNQQHKGHKVFWAHAVGPNNKKYAGSLPLCNKCKCHHNGPCTKMAPKRATRSNIAPETTNTTSVTNAQLQAMINQGVTAALAARDANTNGVDSHNSRTGARRNERATRECTYPDFMKCQPPKFQGSRRIVELNSMD
ncbi:hypothetical protein Tco_0436236 [Tanacetum coccineum]